MQMLCIYLRAGSDSDLLLVCSKLVDDFSFLCVCHISACKFMQAYFSVTGLIS